MIGLTAMKMTEKNLKRGNTQKEANMFYWSVVLFIIALVAAIFGFAGIASSIASIAKIVFFVALIMAIISFIMSRGRSIST